MKRLFRNSLHSKLVLAFAVALLPVLLLMLLGYRANVRESERSVLDSQLLAAEAVAVQVEETFDAALGVAWAVANDPLVQSLDRPHLDEHLNRLMGRHPFFKTIAVFEANGRNRGWADETGSVPPRPNVSDRSYFQAVLGTNGPVISEVLQSKRSNGASAVIAAVPLRDNADRVAGVVAVAMPTVQLSKWYEETRLRPGQTILLSDRAGRLAFYSSIRHLSEEQAGMFVNFPAVRRALSGTPETLAKFESPLIGDERIGAFVPTPRYHWAVGITMPRDMALAPVHAALKRQLLGVVGTLLLSGLIATLMAKQLTSPLSHLRTHAQAIGHGTLCQRVSVKTGDEFEELGEAFNEMAQQIQSRDAHLRASEERFRATFEQAAVGIAHTTVDGYWLWVNDRLCEILGYSREELATRTFQEITHPDDLAPNVELMHELLRGTLQKYSLEKRYYRKDGTWIWVNSTITLAQAPDGQPAYFIAVIEDIQKRKQMEEDRKQLLQREQAARASAEAANRAKDQLLAMVSHELRTPLTPVLAALDLLEEDTAFSPGSKSCLKMIRGNVEMEARLVSDLLDLTRIHQAKIELHREAVDVHKLLEDVIVIFEHELRAKGLHLEREFLARQHTLVADRDRLQQVFWNLISNAVKYTPQGGDIVVLSQNESGVLRICFKDTGIGIAPEMMSRLFNPFEQAEQTLTRRYGGLGIGLAISKSLVELHEGKITAKSDGVGKGCIFTVEFPLPTMPIAETRTGAAPTSAPPSGQHRILLVEDNLDTQQILSKLLKRSGHHVETASSAREALESASRDNPDLVVSDIGLPDASGWQLLREMSRIHPVRAIAISGFGTPEDQEKSREAGFLHHLVKPINYQALEEAIDEVCSNHKAGEFPVPQETTAAV